MSTAQGHEQFDDDAMQSVSRYPVDAFEFLHQGLDFTVRKKHGPPNERLRLIYQWLEKSEMDPAELIESLKAGEVPAPIRDQIKALGGPDEAVEHLNRHVGGSDLCWGLRELALQRWGFLAPTVLRRWGIHSTRDFGRMVFTLVENNLLQKQMDDCIEDFDGVYDFNAAFNHECKGDIGAASDGPND